MTDTDIVLILISITTFLCVTYTYILLREVNQFKQTVSQWIQDDTDRTR
jgi:hypothetical protein